MLVDLGPELDFLDLDDVLVPLRFARALLLLVLILPVIHDPADGRHRRGGDLHEVEPLLPGDGQGLRRGHDAQLLAGVINDADFTNADAFVDAEPVVAPAGAITIESDSARKSSEVVQTARRHGSDGSLTAPIETSQRTHELLGYRFCRDLGKRIGDELCRPRRAPRSPLARLRTATAPSAASRSPTTSM